MDLKIDKGKRIFPFNNSIETGLRVLSLLNAAFPTAHDINTIVLFDYLTVHSGDVEGGMESLHPAVPNRSGEIFVRHNIIEEGLELFVCRGLIEKVYSDSGIEYTANEDSTPFLESLSEIYAIQLIMRAEWVVKNFSSYSYKELSDFMNHNIGKQKNEFNLEILV